MLSSFSSIWTVLEAVVLFVLVALIRGLRHNTSIAKSTGLRYIIVPCHVASIPWLSLQPIILPVLDFLPDSWTSKWLPYVILLITCPRGSGYPAQ